MTVDTTLTPATDNDTNQALHLREHPPTQLDDYSVAPVPSSAVTPKPTPSQSSTATPCTPLRVTHLPRTTAIHSLFSQPKSHQDHHETADTKPCQPVDIHLSPTAGIPTYGQPPSEVCILGILRYGRGYVKVVKIKRPYFDTCWLIKDEFDIFSQGHKNANT